MLILHCYYVRLHSSVQHRSGQNSAVRKLSDVMFMLISPAARWGFGSRMSCVKARASAHRLERDISHVPLWALWKISNTWSPGLDGCVGAMHVVHVPCAIVWACYKQRCWPWTRLHVYNYVPEFTGTEHTACLPSTHVAQLCFMHLLYSHSCQLLVQVNL